MYTIQEYDTNKTKVLKYVLYKKRTKREVWQKFSTTIDENMLEDILAELEENGYIGDTLYIERAIKEFMALRTLSIKEIQYKLMAKGIERSALETYIDAHQEELQAYEIQSVQKIMAKKQMVEEREWIGPLLKKGYKEDSIRKAMEED